MPNLIDLATLIARLPMANRARLHRQVEALLLAAVGPGECLCCGRVIGEIHDRPPCGATVRIWGRDTACANDGNYWMPLTTIEGPELEAAARRLYLKYGAGTDYTEWRTLADALGIDWAAEEARASREQSTKGPTP